MVTTNTIRALGVFTSSQEIEQTINELKASDFPMERISVIAKDLKSNNPIDEPQISDRINNQKVDTTAVVRDTLTTATWGSVLVGLSSLVLPGLGVVIAAGSVGVALVTSVAGMAVGVVGTQNLVKALTDLGVPEEQARVYSDRLQQGYYLLILEGSAAEMDRAEAILHERDIHNWGIYDSLKVEK